MTDLPVRYSPDQIRSMAEAVVKSQLFPNIKTPEAAMTLMLLCDAEGIHPMMALRRWDIIQGRPALKTDAMLAEFQKRGGKVTWLQMTEECCEAEFMASGLGAPVRIKVDTADAKRAGLLNKDNWIKYPRQMRRARVISEGVRAADPGVNAGVYTPEEVQDFEPVAPQDQDRPRMASGIRNWVQTAPPVLSDDPIIVMADDPSAFTDEPSAFIEAAKEDESSPLFNGGTKEAEPPSRCPLEGCNGAVALYFSDSKRFPRRPYYQCAKAYDEKLRLMSEGATNAVANAAVSAHHRSWAPGWRATE